jgi:hypothetical protein
MSEQEEPEPIEPEPELADLQTTDEDAENVKASGAAKANGSLQITQLYFGTS